MNAIKDKYYQANSASFGYSNDMRLFKHYDYRCLKPKVRPVRQTGGQTDIGGCRVAFAAEKQILIL